ncbi:sensor histidine kinase [Ellagibacter isourolithinifaciens]|uniref:sensor histidine kinase n=1 Tax=Ellagibacter isourolithinifaciens TaxID=2137581 RepID=UPI003AAA70CD
MLKKLRIKFIALNMATVAVVLAVIFSAICVINYQQSVASVHEAMSNAIAFTESKNHPMTDGDTQGQEGARGQDAGDPGQGQEQDAGDPDERADGDWKDDGARHGTPPQIGGGPAGSGPHIPVAVYRILKSGSYALAGSAASASIADDVLEKAISQLANAPDGSGELADLGLFYEKRTSDTGIARVAFVDVSSANGWQTLALTLAGVGVVALAIFFVISVFFSRWALRPVKRAWEQQRQFVADLLLLARLDAEETDIVKSKPKERIDLSNLVEGELLQFESVAFERAIELKSNVDEGIAVQGSIERLRRLVTTLLDNACKYAGDNGKVRVELHVQDGGARFAVHNTGSLIPAEDLQHVFDRFYRADKARTSGAGGFGLGLSIAKEVAEEHGGTITAKSSDEEGTTFTATLPTA